MDKKSTSSVLKIVKLQNCASETLIFTSWRFIWIKKPKQQQKETKPIPNKQAKQPPNRYVCTGRD